MIDINNVTKNITKIMATNNAAKIPRHCIPKKCYQRYISKIIDICNVTRYIPKTIGINNMA